MEKILDFKTYEKFNSSPESKRFCGLSKNIHIQNIIEIRLKKRLAFFPTFGGKDFIQNKIINFAHAEYDDEKFYNKQNIQNSIGKGIDLYGDKTIKIKKLDKLIYKNLPKNIQLLIK